MKPRPPSNPQTLSELMVMAEDFAGFSLRSGRQIPPTLLAATKRGPLFFTPASLQDDRSKDVFADTARLICIAYQVPAAVMILESWMKMAAEGENPDMDERPSDAIDRHEVVMVRRQLVGDGPAAHRGRVDVETEAAVDFGGGAAIGRGWFGGEQFAQERLDASGPVRRVIAARSAGRPERRR